MNNPKSKKANILVKITFVLAILLALFFTFSLLPKLIQDIIENGISAFYTGGWEVLVMVWTYIVFMIGFTIAWWNKLIGGIVIILSSLLQMLPFLIIGGNLGSLIFGIPLLVVGILFLVIQKT